jgi:AAHS family 4-hydroxybenzoate transporter-like MFS transporter
VGRVGSIVGPLVGGVLLSLQWSAGEVFVAAALAALCAALAALSLSRLAGLGGSGKRLSDPARPLEAVTRVQA